MLLVTHSDDFGRQAGDAFTIKHRVVPTSPRTIDDVDGALDALDRVGLIVRYEINDRKYVQIEEFDAHQQGLHKRTKSKFPDIPETSGNLLPRARPRKRSEAKRSETKQIPTTTSVATKPATESGKAVYAFLKRFCELYAEYRHGSKYTVNRARDVPNITRLLNIHGHDRLVKLATVLLQTDEEFIERTDRGISIFTVKINWLEDRLRDYEASH